MPMLDPFKFEPMCMLCTSEVKCLQHRQQPISREDIYKAGFEALEHRLCQVKADLEYEKVLHERTKRELKRAHADLDRLKAYLSEMPTNIKPDSDQFQMTPPAHGE